MKRFFAAALALLMLISASALAEADAQTSQLTVTGEATVSLPADRAVVSLAVQETGQDVKVAQASVNEKITAIRKALVDGGTDNADITTDSLYIYANYDYSESGDGQIKSYSVTNRLRVVVRDVNNAGSVIDTAFAAGANTLDSIQFVASDDSAARDQAYQQAVEAAMHKAEVIAESAGMRCAGIVKIDENTSNDWYYEAANYARDAAATPAIATGGAVQTDIQASSILVRASVSITLQLVED